MSGEVWTPKQEALLRRLYPSRRTVELPALIGRTRSAIKNRAAAMHLKKNADVNMHRAWSRAEDALMRKLYAEHSNESISQRVGRSVASVNNRAHTLDLYKSEAYMRRTLEKLGVALKTSGARSRFPKGHVPLNKGLRRPGWHRGRMQQTQFKKGSRNGRAEDLWKPIGTVRISKDGYLERKINEGMPLQRRWRAVHLLVWEAANGPLPPGHAVAFKNRNRKDVRLENLELLTRADLMRRNTVHNLPPELKKTVYALGSLKSTITKKTKRIEREKQNRRSA